MSDGTIRRVRVAAAVIEHHGRLLMTRRPPGGPLGLLWEFPGGKIEPGETPAAALERELHEELGVAGTAADVIAVESYTYPHGLEVEIHFVRAALASHAFTPSAAVHEWRWVRAGDVNADDVLAADRAFLARLAARRTTGE